jgi:hypothetical protein
MGHSVDVGAPAIVPYDRSDCCEYNASNIEHDLFTSAELQVALA